MKVRFNKKELFIEPETEFESEILSDYRNCTAHLKSGLSLAETVGIVIRQECKLPIDVVKENSTIPTRSSLIEDCKQELCKGMPHGSCKGETMCDPLSICFVKAQHLPNTNMDFKCRYGYESKCTDHIDSCDTCMLDIV